METFAEWLKLEIHHRRWSQAELARQTGTSTGLVSYIAKGKRAPSTNFCVALAKAFDLPAEVVLQRAGLVPLPEDNHDALYKEICALVERLPTRKKEILIHMVRALVDV